MATTTSALAGGAAPLHGQAGLADMVDALCAAGRAHEAHHRVSLFLLSSSCGGHGIFNALLRRLLRAGTPLLTLRLLQAATPLLLPSLPNYNRLLHLLCSEGFPLPLLAHRLLLRMHVPPDAASYAALLDGYACLRDPCSARQLLDEMPRSGVAPNSLAGTFVVKAFLRSRDVDGALGLMANHVWPNMARCREEDQSVKNAAFANLVQCLCDQGFFHIVFRIAEEMPQREGGVPDEFAYGQVMDSLCRAGQHHGASRIVYMMAKGGLRPSAVSYNCIVHGLCTSRKPRACLRAHQLVMEGAQFGYCPSEATYKALVDALCGENELAKAKDVLELVLQLQLQDGDADDMSRTRVYNIFLGALRAAGNPSQQLDVLVSMLQKQCRPDMITMNTVVHGFCKVGRVQEARRIVDDMLNGKFCPPDVVTFTTLLCGYLDVGNHAEALHVLCTLMPTRRCSPNVVTYNGVLKGLFSLGQVDSAMQVFHEMKANGVGADCATHTVVIKGLCEAGQLEKAKTLWDDVVWPSGIHDDYVYAAIFEGLCKLGKLDQACDFLYELVDCGVALSVVCYNILINAACELGSKKLAYQLVKEMRRNGLAPDAVTRRILGKLHRCSKEEELPTLDADASAADDKVERLVSVENTIPSPSSSRNAQATNDKVEPVISTENEKTNEIRSSSSSTIIREAMDEDDNKAEIEEEVGCLSGLIDNQPDCNELAKEEGNEDDKSDDAAGETTIAKDAHGWPPTQHVGKEPLSRLARKVFGLL